MQCSEEICLKHLKLEMQHKFATVFIVFLYVFDLRHCLYLNTYMVSMC